MGDVSASCGRFEDAGIVCQGTLAVAISSGGFMILPLCSEQATQYSNCTTGSVRLADPREQANTIQGRVEVCINQAWGTVCSDKFDQEDAGTVCVAAGGFLRNGVYILVDTEVVIMIVTFSSCYGCEH